MLRIYRCSIYIGEISKDLLHWDLFKFQFIQDKVTNISYIGTFLKIGLYRIQFYSGFGLYRIPFYSVFSLSWFCFIQCSVLFRVWFRQDSVLFSVQFIMILFYSGFGLDRIPFYSGFSFSMILFLFRVWFRHVSLYNYLRNTEDSNINTSLVILLISDSATVTDDMLTVT